MEMSELKVMADLRDQIKTVLITHQKAFPPKTRVALVRAMNHAREVRDLEQLLEAMTFEVAAHKVGAVMELLEGR